MPFKNNFVELVHFEPDESYDPERDRLQITLDDGSSIVVQFENRSGAILNPLLQARMHWLDYRRAPGKFSKLAKPIPEKRHAGYSVTIRRDRRVELELVSQEHIGGHYVSEGTVVAIMWTRSTTHSTFRYTESIPIEPAKRVQRQA